MRTRMEKYEQRPGSPLGCFSMKLSGNGWAESRYENLNDVTLNSQQIGEFVGIVDDFMTDFPVMSALTRMIGKRATRIGSEGFDDTYAVNIPGDELNYSVHITGREVLIFPFRKEEN